MNFISNFNAFSWKAMQPTARRSDASPSRNCSHQAFPFVEAPAKTKLAGSIEAQPGHRRTALTAFCIDFEGEKACAQRKS
jgi:hypothetical protein